jgi:hypothetical protein
MPISEIAISEIAISTAISIASLIGSRSGDGLGACRRAGRPPPGCGCAD